MSSSPTSSSTASEDCQLDGCNSRVASFQLCHRHYKMVVRLSDRAPSKSPTRSQQTLIEMLREQPTAYDRIVSGMHSPQRIARLAQRVLQIQPAATRFILPCCVAGCERLVSGRRSLCSACLSQRNKAQGLTPSQLTPAQQKVLLARRECAGTARTMVLMLSNDPAQRMQGLELLRALPPKLQQRYLLMTLTQAAAERERDNAILDNYQHLYGAP